MGKIVLHAEIYDVNFAVWKKHLEKEWIEEKSSFFPSSCDCAQCQAVFQIATHRKYQINQLKRHSIAKAFKCDPHTANAKSRIREIDWKQNFGRSILLLFIQSSNASHEKVRQISHDPQ